MWHLAANWQFDSVQEAKLERSNVGAYENEIHISTSRKWRGLFYAVKQSN